ncbi:hypothetical protein [Frisingicoccus sp.]|uniref:hypothetical protein n=1 Tax=Frisingicoccus sp. TaxID=1918627 RepID=UPI003AB2832E
MKGHLDVKELETYKKADLQQLARNLGVSDAGTIKEIAARCAAVEVEIPDEGEMTDEEKKAAQAAARAEEERKAAEAAQAAARAEEERKAAAAAGMVKVEVTTRYLDKQLNQIKDAGETFTVHKNRAEELVRAKVAKIKE